LFPSPSVRSRSSAASHRAPDRPRAQLSTAVRSDGGDGSCDDALGAPKKICTQVESWFGAADSQDETEDTKYGADRRGGYCSEDNLKELNRRGIRGYVATGRQKHGEKTATGKRIPKAGTRVREMWAKLKRGGHESRYRLRKIVGEPVFGHLKAARGFRQFLLRGQENVGFEFSIVSTAHNLGKLFVAGGI